MRLELAQLILNNWDFLGSAFVRIWPRFRSSKVIQWKELIVNISVGIFLWVICRSSDLKYRQSIQVSVNVPLYLLFRVVSWYQS